MQKNIFYLISLCDTIFYINLTFNVFLFVFSKKMFSVCLYLKGEFLCFLHKLPSNIQIYFKYGCFFMINVIFTLNYILKYSNSIAYHFTMHRYYF